MLDSASPNLKKEDVEQTAASDPFLLYFTSGTTKYPKMVLHRCTYPLGHVRTAGLCMMRRAVTLYGCCLILAGQRQPGDFTDSGF
jgi:acyl-coenzyme A synthetase/AMP-(fatty) acid ligase